ncbi:hypothetical protein [Streptomyces sp. cf386]|uniref:hypothetical protein n=1 Tax=Streptomyces sp. cf386 TaxID=1761904 RepID=UPI00210BA3AA|nr:hypothetical protein [Streptomyces sp. cf386]
MTQAVVEVGARLRYDGRVWTLAVLEGARATLVSDEGASAVVLLPYLFADPSFEVERGPAPARVPPFGLLEALPVEVRERALAWQRHVREVETGFPDAVGQGAPREQFDPATRSLAQRERAKAEELTAAGWAASAATVRRMRARYRSEGLWGWWTAGRCGSDPRWGGPMSGWSRQSGKCWRGSGSGRRARWCGCAAGWGGCWIRSSAPGRWPCRRRRRSTGWCTQWPTDRAFWGQPHNGGGMRRGRHLPSRRRWHCGRVSW